MDAVDYRTLQGVDKWYAFSSQPRTEEEIEEMLLTDPDNICVSYVCQFSKLSEDFIEKMIVLSTGLLSKENYDESFDAVKEVMQYQYEHIGEKGCEPKSLVYKDKNGLTSIVSSASVGDRVDWKAISIYQTLSTDFIRKYIKVLHINSLLSKKYIPIDVILELKLRLAGEAPKRTTIHTGKYGKKTGWKDADL